MWLKLNTNQNGAWEGERERERERYNINKNYCRIVNCGWMIGVAHLSETDSIVVATSEL